MARSSTGAVAGSVAQLGHEFVEVGHAEQPRVEFGDGTADAICVARPKRSDDVRVWCHGKTLDCV